LLQKRTAEWERGAAAAAKGWSVDSLEQVVNEGTQLQQLNNTTLLHDKA
jgi:hypothetical protein